MSLYSLYLGYHNSLHPNNIHHHAFNIFFKHITNFSLFLQFSTYFTFQCEYLHWHCPCREHCCHWHIFPFCQVYIFYIARLLQGLGVMSSVTQVNIDRQYFLCIFLFICDDPTFPRSTWWRWQIRRGEVEHNSEK